MNSKHLTNKQIIEAIQGTGGLLAMIAKKLQVTRQTIHNYVKDKKNDDIRAALEQERETILDVAEGELIKKIKSGEEWACKFTLARLGKHRGYTEKVETEQANDVNIILRSGKLKKKI